MNQIYSAAAPHFGECNDEDGIRVGFIECARTPRLHDHSSGNKHDIPAMDRAAKRTPFSANLVTDFRRHPGHSGMFLGVEKCPI